MHACHNECDDDYDDDGDHDTKRNLRLLRLLLALFELSAQCVILLVHLLHGGFVRLDVLAQRCRLIGALVNRIAVLATLACCSNRFVQSGL